jgi:AraC-like DNA-binding protein
MLPFGVVYVLPWFIGVQGAVLAVAAFSNRRHRSNRYLAIFLSLMSLHGLVGLAWSGPETIHFPELTILFTCFPFLYGPLVYRYVWFSLFPNIDEKVPFYLHAIPWALNLALYLFFYVLAGRGAFTEVTRSVFSGSAPGFVLVVEYAKVASGLFYTFLIGRLLYRNIDGLKRWAARRARRRWLTALVIAFGINWSIVLVSATILWREHLPEMVRVIVTGVQLIAFLALLYLVTFFAIRYPAVLDPKEAREAIRRKLDLAAGFVEETRRRLDKMIEHRVHTDPDITLTSMAEKVGVHPNVLSYIVNEEFGVGFREYLNSLRLDEFLRISRTMTDDSTYLARALDAGFSSKSTFLRAFRRRFGTTPREYFSETR